MSSIAKVIEPADFRRGEAPASGKAGTAPARNNLRKKLLASLGASVAIAALAGGGYWWAVGRYHVSTDNAYVGASLAQINAQVTGPLANVLVEDTQPVRKGDVLAIIDPSDAKLAVARAQADYQRTLQRVSQYYAQRAVAAATVQAKAAELDRARDDYGRRQVLAETGTASAVAVSTAKSYAEAAQANLIAAQESLTAQDELIKGVGADNHPETLAAKAALDKAQLDLSRTVIYAPVDGVVSQRKAQIGQTVQPGQTLMTVTPLADVYVDANFKEGQLTDVRVGQPVKLISDLYGDHVVYRGKVVGLGGGTGSAFAIIPAQNATGNWIKVVQRVPVRIALDRSELAEHPLRVGLSMTASIDTRQGAE